MDRIEELRYLVLAAQREGSRRFTQALRPLGLTPAQAEVLTVLRTCGRPLAVRELGSLLVCESGSPSRLARTLVAAGLVESAPDGADARVTRLRLTAAGSTAARGVEHIERGFHAALAASLPDGAALDPLVDLLRGVASGGPAGQALARRRDLSVRSSTED